MSKSKSKSKSSKGATKSEPSFLSKVKDAAVVKPTQTPKAKSKDEAKQVAIKEGMKGKSKKAQSPLPASSESSASSDSEDSASSARSESEEESTTNVKIKKPLKNGKANGLAANDVDSTDASEADSESSESSDESVADVPAVERGSTSGESEEESEDENVAEEKPAEKGAVQAGHLSKRLTPIRSDQNSDDNSDEDEDEDDVTDDSEAESEDSDRSDESSEEGVEEASLPADPVPTSKRKAEKEVPVAAKKAKTDEMSVEADRGSNLFVGNLSWNVDEEWLKSEFAQFGELSGVRVMTDRATGRSKGFGYVEFTNAANAKKAHEAKVGSELDGRKINVDFANARSSGGQQDRAQSRAKSFGDQASAPSDTLFVGNLSFDAGQEAVSEAFADFGTVMSVRLPTDRETGAPKGFGYVSFSSVDEAKGALEGMQGGDIAGRPCRLDFSQPRPSNGDSPARGGRGGGRGSFGGRGSSRGGFGDRGGRGGGRGRGFGDRGGRGGRGGSTNRGGFGDYAGKKTTF